MNTSVRTTQFTVQFLGWAKDWHLERPIEILTLSNSFTIVAAFKDLFRSSKSLPILLTILESQPLLEGLALAKALLPQKPDNCTIQITTDASAAFFPNLADIVLLGADEVNPNKGDVKNKIGSLSATQNTRGYVWCVASTDKIESGYEMEVFRRE
jgi:translation initiation factor 2B subunit (eIF-2B alpha/beta/delta family)